MKQVTEQRAFPRKVRCDSVSIDLMLVDKNKSGLSKVMATETLDVSATGMKIACRCELPRDMLIDVCVDTVVDKKNFLLTTEVRWCRPIFGSENYEVGLQIHQASKTDYASWSHLFEN